MVLLDGQTNINLAKFQGYYYCCCYGYYHTIYLFSFCQPQGHGR